MSGREWKPGDVARVNGAMAVRATHVWHTQDGVLSDPNVAHARPLVVIDPEDAEQVERLRDAFWNANNASWQGMQVALRSLITPPKPEEPTGKYAVVADADGNEWVRLGNGPAPWMFNGSPSNRDTYAYGQIAAVRVLSKGVTA